MFTIKKVDYATFLREWTKADVDYLRMYLSKDQVVLYMSIWKDGEQVSAIIANAPIQWNSDNVVLHLHWTQAYNMVNILKLHLKTKESTLVGFFSIDTARGMLKTAGISEEAAYFTLRNKKYARLSMCGLYAQYTHDIPKMSKEYELPPEVTP